MAYLRFKTWKKLRSRQLLYLIVATNALAVSFEGYAQGVLGLTNGSPSYLRYMNVPTDGMGNVINQTRLGGITSSYYAGALFGAFLSGYLSDKLGRVTGLQLGSLWCILGTALEASTQNASWQICARVIAGIGVGHMNTIAPTWTAEVSEAGHRGKLFSVVYLSNYAGIALAYWFEFGLSFIDGGTSEIQWRLPFAVNGIFPLLLFCILPFVPESPRYLIGAKKEDEALEVLAATRANGNKDDKAVLQEMEDMKANVEFAEQTADRDNYLNMITGHKSGKLHFGRRTMLAFWLPCLTQIGSGIVSTTIYTPTLIQTTGWSTRKGNWLSALNNTVGILGTVIAMYTIDPVGRRKTLLWGSLAASITMWIVGAMSVCTTEYPVHATQFGSASISFIYIFTLIYSSTYLIINFNYASEIFPTEVRTHGVAFGVAGWALGVGAATLYSPTMFESLGGYGFMIFAGLNLLYFVLIYLFLPETSGRTLEQIDVLFEEKKPFNRSMEHHFQDVMRHRRGGSEATAVMGKEEEGQISTAIEKEQLSEDDAGNAGVQPKEDAMV